jgi:FeS assembly SUF system protein
MNELVMTKSVEAKNLEKDIIEVIKTIYDPEIPVDIWELGLIYKLEVDNDFNVVIDMTLTAPNCPVADSIIFEVREKTKATNSVKTVVVNLVFDPPWYPDLMTEEAKLQLGML